MAYKISDECIACGACAGACPVGCIYINKSGHEHLVVEVHGPIGFRQSIAISKDLFDLLAADKHRCTGQIAVRRNNMSIFEQKSCLIFHFSTFNRLSFYKMWILLIQVQITLVQQPFQFHPAHAFEHQRTQIRNTFSKIFYQFFGPRPVAGGRQFVFICEESGWRCIFKQDFLVHVKWTKTVWN